MLIVVMFALAACVCLGITKHRVRFVRPYENYEVGDFAVTDADGVSTLVRDGVAELDEGDNPTKSGSRSKPGRPQLFQVRDLSDDDPKWGYKNLAEFFLDVREAGTPGGNPRARERLIARTTKAAGSDEAATIEDSIGGFLIPPAFGELITKPIESEFVMNPALGNASVINVNSTSYKVPIEVDTSRTGDILYGGIQAYRTPERIAMTPTRGKVEQIEIKPEDMTGLAYVTDNQIHHAPDFANILARWFKNTIQYKRTGEFLFGNGLGQSLGAFNSGNGSLISVTRTATGTISTDDVLTMESKCFDYPNAIWMASPDAKPAIRKLTISVGTGGSAVMLFNIATAGQPESLLGRPIVFTEFAAALGSANDLMLASWPHYLIGFTGRQVNDSSPHVRYEYNETAFRFVEQFQGLPWWRTTLTLRNSFVQSPFITLAA